MSDRSAFERQVQSVLQKAAGPSRPVDAWGVVDRLATRSIVGRVTPATRRLRVEAPSVRTSGRFTMYSAFKFAAAGAVLALFGGLLLSGIGAPEEVTMPALDSDAASVRSEVLFELAVPSETFPEDFQGIAIEDLTLAAGTDVSEDRHTSQANESMRNRAFIVTSGAFLIEPTTDALLWRALDAPPAVAPAGEAVTLGPGEALYLPAVPAEEVDPDKYLRIANPGAEDATAWSLHAHQASGASFGGFPPGLTAGTWHPTSPVGVIDAADWLVGGDVRFRLTRHSAEPGAVVTVPDAPALSIYLVEAGKAEHVVSGSGGGTVNLLRAGNDFGIPAFEGVEQTLTVVGDEAASLLELVAVPPTVTQG